MFWKFENGPNASYKLSEMSNSSLASFEVGAVNDDVCLME